MKDIVTTSLLVGGGGFLGANARFWLGALIASRTGNAFPWATMTINVSGSFLIGVIMPLALRGPAPAISPGWFRFLAVGILGGYTTFSTFESETLQLFEGGQTARAAGYALGSLAAGCAAVWLGSLLGKLLVPR